MSRLFDPSEMRRERQRLGLAEHLRRIPLAEPGECADCREDGPRRRYGPRLICSACTESRLHAAARIMDADEFADLVSKLAA